MTTVLALSTNQVTWMITLVVGVVVAGVVWALLEILRRTVLQVDEAVTAVWIMGKRLAQNTQTTYLLQTMHARGDDLNEELDHHGQSEQHGQSEHDGQSEHQGQSAERSGQ